MTGVYAFSISDWHDHCVSLTPDIAYGTQWWCRQEKFILSVHLT